MLTSEQIEVRLQGLGGSDSPITAGLSPRMTDLELFYVKRAGVEGRQIIEPSGDLQHEAWVGNAAEPVIDAWFQRELEVKTHKVHQTQWHRDTTELPWMLCHPDRRVVGQKAGAEYKIRARGSEWGPSGTDYIPDDIRVQVNHCMEVYDYDLWYVAVWLPPFDFRWYAIERDRSLVDLIVEIDSAFWTRVQTDKPPPADYDHSTTYGLMQRMYPGTTGQSLELDPSYTHWHHVLQDAREKRLAYEKLEAGARNHILEALGHNAIGYLHDGDGAAYIRETREDGSLKRFYHKRGIKRG